MSSLDLLCVPSLWSRTSVRRGATACAGQPRAVAGSGGGVSKRGGEGGGVIAVDHLLSDGRGSQPVTVTVCRTCEAADGLQPAAVCRGVAVRGAGRGAAGAHGRGRRPLSEPAILTARAAPDILAALARATWHKAHDGAPCPAKAIPTPAALAEWLHDCPEAAFVEATARLNAMTAGAAEWVWTVNRPLPGLSAPDMTPEVIAHDGYYIASVVNLHARWRRASGCGP